jgi:flagellar protein FlbD
MIHLTRINHVPLVLNSDRIEYVESTPDTVVTLTNGQKIVVLEPVEEVVRRVIEFRREIVRGSLRCPNAEDSAGEACIRMERKDANREESSIEDRRL